MFSIFVEVITHMVIIRNKKATYNYNILEKFTAGIILIGTEVKSLRALQASIAEAFCSITNNEIHIHGMHISPYKEIKHTQHDVLRIRKLLLNRKEINKISKSLREKGTTIIPLSVMLTERGLFKIEIGLVRGKKEFEKRDSIKKKDMERELRNG